MTSRLPELMTRTVCTGGGQRSCEGLPATADAGLRGILLCLSPSCVLLPLYSPQCIVDDISSNSTEPAAQLE